MSLEQVLRAAVREKPHDQTARLALADWLEEQAGEQTPEAELIRIEVELDRPIFVTIEELLSETFIGEAKHRALLRDSRQRMALRLRTWDLTVDLKRNNTTSLGRFRHASSGLTPAQLRQAYQRGDMVAIHAISPVHE